MTGDANESVIEALNVEEIYKLLTGSLILLTRIQHVMVRQRCWDRILAKVVF